MSLKSVFPLTESRMIRSPLISLLTLVLAPGMAFAMDKGGGGPAGVVAPALLPAPTTT